jgi:uncharacterized protein YgiM (DUF1202 family)
MLSNGGIKMIKCLRRTGLVLVLFTVFTLHLSAAEMMSVTVKETQVRDRPSFLGKIVATLVYGDRIPISTERGDWVQVNTDNGITGWVHLSALTKKQIVLQEGDESVEQSATSEEVAMAGKGFNKEVEQQYKEEKNLDYTWIDRMEKIVYPSETLFQFLDGQDVPAGDIPQMEETETEEGGKS